MLFLRVSEQLVRIASNSCSLSLAGVEIFLVQLRATGDSMSFYAWYAQSLFQGLSKSYFRKVVSVT